MPLALSVAISIALILFGSGPGTSDAKVNLFGFQPGGGHRDHLLVFFLAGYFASRWEFLRELREENGLRWRISRGNRDPASRLHASGTRLSRVSPGLLHLQKDLGPALVFACLFLVLYAVARNRVAFAAFGAFLLIGGFASGYLQGFPKTVSERVQMWLSPGTTRCTAASRWSTRCGPCRRAASWAPD